MSEMVERVAKAIDRADTEWTRQKGDAQEGLSGEPVYGLPETLARAAIEAMREPTDEMMESGCEKPIYHCWGSEGEFTDAQSAGDIFRDMIDEALK